MNIDIGALMGLLNLEVCDHALHEPEPLCPDS